MTTSSATASSMEPLETISVNQAIQQRIIQYIRSGELAIGDRLPSEGDLARNLGVGRNAVREALRSLEALGILQARVGSGWYIRATAFDAVAQALVLSLELNRDTFYGLNQIRLCLEFGLFPTASARLTPDDLDVLQDVVDDMEEKARRGIVPVEEDRRFHELLFLRLNNPVFDRLMAVIWDVYAGVVAERELPTEANIRETSRHRPIVDALRAGDASLALQRLRESLVSVETSYIWPGLPTPDAAG